MSYFWKRIDEKLIGVDNGLDDTYTIRIHKDDETVEFMNLPECTVDLKGIPKTDLIVAYVYNQTQMQDILDLIYMVCYESEPFAVQKIGGDIIGIYRIEPYMADNNCMVMTINDLTIFGHIDNFTELREAILELNG